MRVRCECDGAGRFGTETRAQRRFARAFQVYPQRNPHKMRLCSARSRSRSRRTSPTRRCPRPAVSPPAADPDLVRLAGLVEGDGGLADDISARAASDAVRRVLTQLARRRPVLLALDDVQWADEGTMDVLTSLMRRPPRGGVVVVLCYRPLPSLHALSDARPGRIEGPVVGSLHRFELAALTEGRWPSWSPTRRRPAGGRCSAPAGATRSSSRRSTPARATSSRTPRTATRLPVAVSNALATELDALDPAVRLVAETAAVVGGSVDPDLVAQVAGLSMNDVLDALDDLSERTICRQVGPAGGGSGIRCWREPCTTPSRPPHASAPTTSRPRRSWRGAGHHSPSGPATWPSRARAGTPSGPDPRGSRRPAGRPGTGTSRLVVRRSARHRPTDRVPVAGGGRSWPEPGHWSPSAGWTRRT